MIYKELFILYDILGKNKMLEIERDCGPEKGRFYEMMMMVIESRLELLSRRSRTGFGLGA